MVELSKRIREALNYVRAQASAGYIDLGAHDELEVDIVSLALDVWQQKMECGYASWEKNAPPNDLRPRCPKCGAVRPVATPFCPMCGVEMINGGSV